MEFQLDLQAVVHSLHEFRPGQTFGFELAEGRLEIQPLSSEGGNKSVFKGGHIGHRVAVNDKKSLRHTFFCYIYFFKKIITDIIISIFASILIPKYNLYP